MFTGIIEEMGKIERLNIGGTSGSIEILGKKVLAGTRIGDSIAVNGVCLTVTKLNGNVFTADVMAETFRRSSLSKLRAGSYVNLERAMAADGRFGGHIVSGHIDGTGVVTDIVKEENATWYTVSAGSDLLKYIVEKGSIAIDGISLTVAYVDGACFKVSIIPHTGSETVLQYRKKGDMVNLECDIIGKYVEKLLGLKAAEESSDNKGTFCEGGITTEFLSKCGF